MTRRYSADGPLRIARLLQHPPVAEARRHVIGGELERGLIVSNGILEVLSGASGVSADGAGRTAPGIWLDPGGYDGTSG